MFMCFGVSADEGTPTFSIAFSPTTIAPGGVSTLTYTLDNSAQTMGATDLTFSNTLPTGMTLSSPANGISNCIGVNYTATPGSNSISFSGARVGAGATCTFSVDVTSDAEEANYTNTTSELTSSSGNSGPASDDLVVATSGLVVSLSFSPSTITSNGITTLTYTLDGTVLADNIMAIYMADTLSGLTVSNAPNVGGTCNAQITSGPGSSSIDISNSGTLAAGDSCTITVDVTGDAADTYSNDIESFSYDQPHPSFPSFPQRKYDVTTIAASVNIVLPIMYANFTGFSSPGTSAILTYTISNFQRSDITNLRFTNDLNATLNGLTATALPANDFCGAGSTITGSSTLTISGVNISSGDSCSFAVTVLIPSNAAVGSFTNTSSIVNFDLDGTATTATAISNTLSIQKAPVLSALFIDDPVSAGDDVTLRYAITNTDSVNDATAISFTQTINDTYSGMVIKTLPGTNSCGVGSSVTEYYDGPNYRKVLVDNASLTAGGSCTFDVILTAPSGGTPGSFAFTTSGFSATVNGDLVYGAPASDNLVVIAAPALSLAIVENSVVPGGAVSAELTLNYSINGNADATDVAFSVDLDGALSGMTTTSAVQNNICGSGSSLSGTGTLNLSGASLSPGDSCTFSVILQLPNNTVPSTIVVTSSPVSATTAGQSVSSAAASDSFIISGLSMTQQFISNPALPGASIISRYTISNHANAPAATGMLFTHNYSAVVFSLAATSLPAPGCGASSALSGSTFVIFTGGELLPGASCTFDVPLLIPAGATQGSYNSTTSVINATVNGSNTESDAAASLLTIEQLSVLLTTSEVSPTSVTPFSVSIFFSRDVVNFSASDLLVTNGAATNLQGSGQSYTADITPTADGSVTIDLPANSVDDAVDGTIKNPAASQLSLSYVATATVVTPSINISAPSITSTTSGPVSYTVTYSDVDQVNLTSAAITLNAVGTTATATVTGGDTTTPTVTFSDITGDGTLSFSINAGSARNSTKVAPAAGPSNTFLVDNTAPTLTITDVVAHSINSSFEATFTFSEDVTGFDVTDIVPTNAVLSNFNANSALLYTVTVTPSNDGSVTLNVPSGSVVDRVSLGNIAASQYQIEYDTTRPTVAIEGVTGPIASAFTATIRFSEDVSNFVIGDISAPSATLSNFTAVTASVYTVLVSPIAQGAVTLNIGTNSAIDAASNSNVAAPEYSVVYDSIPPSLTVFLPAQNAVDVSLQTQVTLTFSEVVFATASNNLIEIKNIVGDLVVHSIPADSSAVSITGNIATITLPSDLPERIDLYVTVAANAFEDASGNFFAGFSDNGTWRFTSLNLPPVISGTPATQVDEDANYSFTPTVTDVDVTDTATFSVTNKPGWASFDTTTGALTGTPDNDDVGTTSDIVITVTDIANVADSLTVFSITVTNTNDAPTITLESTLSTDE
ncbi:Ig-like domain-containing protein, partial [Paraglaciecola sp.]|nr:Ig-like domain-containing protein [Paraglaciecola sp.]